MLRVKICIFNIPNIFIENLFRANLTFFYSAFSMQRFLKVKVLLPSHRHTKTEMLRQDCGRQLISNHGNLRLAGGKGSKGGRTDRQ